jgi:hypothetical protein
MTLDLRIPLGLLFTIVGAILFVFGFATRGSAMYVHSAGMDINLIWGLVMLVFGITMFLLGRRADKHPPAPSADDAPRPPSLHRH